MKEAGVQVKSRKKFKVTTDSNHAKPLFDNVLNRDFAPQGIQSGVCSGYYLSLDTRGLALLGHGD